MAHLSLQTHLPPLPELPYLKHPGVSPSPGRRTIVLGATEARRRWSLGGRCQQLPGEDDPNVSVQRWLHGQPPPLQHLWSLHGIPEPKHFLQGLRQGGALASPPSCPDPSKLRSGFPLGRGVSPLLRSLGPRFSSFLTPRALSSSATRVQLSGCLPRTPDIAPERCSFKTSRRIRHDASARASESGDD